MVIDRESKTLNITDIAGWELSVARSGRKRARDRLRPERIKAMPEPAKERILRALLRYFYLTAIVERQLELSVATTRTGG